MNVCEGVLKEAIVKADYDDETAVIILFVSETHLLPFVYVLHVPQGQPCSRENGNLFCSTAPATAITMQMLQGQLLHARCNKRPYMCIPLTPSQIYTMYTFWNGKTADLCQKRDWNGKAATGIPNNFPYTSHTDEIHIATSRHCFWMKSWGVILLFVRLCKVVRQDDGTCHVLFTDTSNRMV